MKFEALVHTAIPTQRATAIPLITSPPKIAMAIITINVVSEVFMVRDSVLFNAWLAFTSSGILGCRVLYSRIRSKITTVSFIA